MQEIRNEIEELENEAYYLGHAIEGEDDTKENEDE
jgi:hypothetical protein